MLPSKNVNKNNFELSNCIVRFCRETPKLIISAETPELDELVETPKCMFYYRDAQVGRLYNKTMKNESKKSFYSRFKIIYCHLED